MSNSVTTNKDYIDELESVKIPQLQAEISTLKTAEENAVKQLSLIRLFSIPFVYNSDKGKSSILSNKYNESWDDHKHLMYDRWYGKTPRHTLISIGTERIIYWVSLVLWMVMTFTLPVMKTMHQAFKLNRLSFIAASYGVFEIACLLVSCWYYIFRPNMINKSEIKKELRKTRRQLKIKSTELTTYENMVKQYQLATIDPNKQFASMKRKTTDNLRQIVDDTVQNIIPKLTYGQIATKYKEILDKCYKLLDMAEENGAIVTEISKIYNIYINDINNVLIKSSKSNDADTSDVYALINNFNDYIDRKIKKFTDLSDMSVKSEINALVNSFMED